MTSTKTTSTPEEKKTALTPEQKLNSGITNRSVDCVRAYLIARTGKNVIFKPEARTAVKELLRNAAIAQDAKNRALQTAFGRPKNWNVDYFHAKAVAKGPRQIFVPLVKTIRKEKPAKTTKPAKSPAPKSKK